VAVGEPRPDREDRDPGASGGDEQPREQRCAARCGHGRTPRQRHAADRERLEDIRTGRTEEAVASYQADGLWRAEASADATREALLRAWWDDEGRPGVDKIMAAPTVTEVEWLNRAARTLRKSRGELGGPALTVALRAPDRPVEAREFAVGDVVLAQRNWAARGVFTGQRGTVTAVDATPGTLTVELFPDGDAAPRSVVLDPEYLTDRLRPGQRRAVPTWERAGLAHAYASTVNGVQGLTTETAYALASTAIYNQLAYVAASRARERTTWFALTPPDPDELEHAAPATAELDPEDMAALRERVDHLRAQHADRMTRAATAVEASRRMRLAGRMRRGGGF
jgi:ATP-dependent exoDNAse (exonuclease V) alpha subunit